MSEIVSHSRSVVSGSSRIELTWAEATDTGRRREINQDAVLSAYPLFVVADGMVRHRRRDREREHRSTGSRRSSRTAPFSPRRSRGGARARGQGHRRAPRRRPMTARGRRSRGFPRSLDHRAAVGHLNIGDSRVYLLRDDTLVQVTTDHSPSCRSSSRPGVSVEEAENHPFGNVITRAVGPSDSVRPDYVRLDVVDGDRFVVCSDGLTKELTDFGIRHFLPGVPRPRRCGPRDDGRRARERRSRQRHDHRAQRPPGGLVRGGLILPSRRAPRSASSAPRPYRAARWGAVE